MATYSWPSVKDGRGEYKLSCREIYRDQHECNNCICQTLVFLTSILYSMCMRWSCYLLIRAEQSGPKIEQTRTGPIETEPTIFGFVSFLYTNDFWFQYQFGLVRAKTKKNTPKSYKPNRTDTKLNRVTSVWFSVHDFHKIDFGSVWFLSIKFGFGPMLNLAFECQIYFGKIDLYLMFLFFGWTNIFFCE